MQSRRAPPKSKYSTPNKRQKKDNTPRGLFTNRLWHCDCNPRLPANSFTVKKDGANKGRRFWTCQLDKEKGCGFFLWNEEAQRREATAVIANSHTEVLPAMEKTEPQPIVQASMLPTPVTTGKQRSGLFNGESTNSAMDHGFEEGSDTDVEGQQSPLRRKMNTISAKRSAQQAGFDEDEYDSIMPVEADLQAVLASHEKFGTPVKMNKTASFGGLDTPDTAHTLQTPVTKPQSTRRLPWDDKQPAQASRDDHLLTPSKPSRVPESAEIMDVPDLPHTPQKSTTVDLAITAPTIPETERFRDAVTDQEYGGSALAVQIENILSPYNIPAAAVTKVCSLVSAQEMKLRGIIRSQAWLRDRLQKKDAETADMQKTLTQLQTDLHNARTSKQVKRAAALRR